MQATLTTTAGQLEKVREAKKAFLEIDEADLKTTRRFKQLSIEIHRMIRVKAPFSGEIRTSCFKGSARQIILIENVLSAGGKRDSI